MKGCRAGAGVGLAVLALAAAACGSSDSPAALPGEVAGGRTPLVTVTTAPATAPPTAPATPSPTAAPPTTVTTTTLAPATTAASTIPPTTLPPTTTTTTLPPLPAGVHNPACVRVIRAGDSLSLLVDELSTEGISVATLQAENGIFNADDIRAGELLDVCVTNEVNDITGGARQAPAAELVAATDRSGVEAQQAKLGAMFGRFGFPEPLVDGISGPVTRRALCAARLALGLPTSRNDMSPGSDEERALMAATSVPVPAGAVTSAARWVLIDQTCQVMFVGEHDTLRYVFPTSTGQEGYRTRNQQRVRAFRYNPALDNNGWHDSTRFPAAEDNPLNGNMYKPIYFHRGQAIHGANNVPPEPASHGCARLRVADQETLVQWLGLGDVTAETYNDNRIGLVVTVQGEYEAGG